MNDKEILILLKEILEENKKTNDYLEAIKSLCELIEILIKIETS
jgi:hypothetical protein